MTIQNRGIGLLALLVGAFLFLRPNNAQAAQISVADQDTSEAPRESDLNPEINPIGGQRMTNLLPTNDSDEISKRIAAFLFMLRSSEHVYPRDVINDKAYGIFYGGNQFSDFSDHPVITGELRPVRLSYSICNASGLGSGCVSTAAGAYQFIRPTWQRLREQNPRLPDFSPQSQDEAAIRLLNELGVIDLLRDGDIEGAIQRASGTWASLPGSRAQQNPKSVIYALDRFSEGLTLA